MSLASLTRLVRLPRSFAKRHPWAEKNQLGHPHGPMLPSTHAFSSPDKEKQAAEGAQRRPIGRVKSAKKLRLSREHLVLPALRRHLHLAMLGIPLASLRRPQACRKSNSIRDFHHCGASLKKL